MTDAAKPLGLIQKLCAVMEAVDHVEKAGHTSSPAGTYDFARDVDVSNALRGELSSRHIFLFSSIVRVETEVYANKSGGRGSISTVYTEHKFVDGDTGETQGFTWASQGMDGQDKGVSKAATSAIKYALLKQFLIPTGEDPDENKVAPKDQPVTRQLPQPRQTAQQPAQEGQQQPPTTVVPYAQQTPSTGTAGVWKWFEAKLKEMGLDHLTAAKILNIEHFKDDLPNVPFGLILEAIVRQQAEAKKAAQ